MPPVVVSSLSQSSRSSLSNAGLWAVLSSTLTNGEQLICTVYMATTYNKTPYLERRHQAEQLAEQTPLSLCFLVPGLVTHVFSHAEALPAALPAACVVAEAPAPGGVRARVVAAAGCRRTSLTMEGDDHDPDQEINQASAAPSSARARCERCAPPLHGRSSQSTEGVRSGSRPASTQPTTVRRSPRDSAGRVHSRSGKQDTKAHAPPQAAYPPPSHTRSFGRRRRTAGRSSPPTSRRRASSANSSTPLMSSL